MKKTNTNIEEKINSDPLVMDPSEIEGSIPTRFERIAARFPQQTAVKSNNFCWSYAHLNRTSNRLAHAILSQRGQGSEPVALMFQHDAEVIAAIMGVLKAGKFYVFLDPSFSRTWLSQILNDLHNPLIICDSPNLHIASELADHDQQLLEYKTAAAVDLQENVELEIFAESPFGVFYTSGSTGAPKGVVRSHKLALNRVWVDNENSPIFPDDRHSILTSCMFAVSSTDILGALLNGAVLCMYDVKNLGLGGLGKWVDQQQITIFRPPVSLFRYMLGTLDDRSKLSSIRYIILSGAPVYRKDILNAKPYFSQVCLFIHRYAASETGIVTQLIIRHNDEIRTPIIPAGFPVAGIEIRILDEDGRELENGETGEVAVRSRILASSYWGQAAGPSDRLNNDPTDDRQRIYLTGDIGRLRPDGCLELLGRNKLLVKISGYRVELSAVESAIREQNEILDAAVISERDPAGENRLVAYLVSSSPVPINVRLLRKRLLEELPAYMVPVYFGLLDRLPLTKNGKIDRDGLPAVDWENFRIRLDYQTPRTPVEKSLHEIWSNSLKIKNIGIKDNFFEIGGDSLLASVVIVQIEKELNIDLPVHTFYKMPTIEGQASYIQGHKNEIADGNDPQNEISLEEKLRLLGYF